VAPIRLAVARAPAAPPAAELSDEEVVRRVCAGEAPLFEVLMRRHNQRVYRAARAILRDDGEAEDAVQQAWLSAYRHLSEFEGRSTFSTWLTRIAVNAALSRTRARASFALPSDADAADEAEPSPGPEERVLAREVAHVLEAAIDELPEIYRSVLVLREVEGLDTAETARCLGLAEGAVKTRLHRARVLLRRILEARAGAALSELFPFGAARCDRVVAVVMAEVLRSRT
jgi:RNA polymerase sigma-70 factor (ECF subfamily)